MKYISVTKRRVYYDRFNNVPAKEITSFEQLKSLPINTDLAIMNNATMLIGKISSKSDDYIWIWDDVDSIPVKPSSFRYGNFMYRLL